MKIWVDDIRTPPDDTWCWARSSIAALHCLDELMIRHEIPEEMSLDHDLGGDDTARPVVLWCCENDFWPVEIRVHSMNPVGHPWLTSMIDRYKT